MADVNTGSVIFEAPPCEVCGEAACYGYGVRLLQGEVGRWYCYEHWPDRKRKDENERV